VRGTPAGNDLERALSNVREHFAALYLLELGVNPAKATIDWMAITQPVSGAAPSDGRCPTANAVSASVRAGGHASFTLFV